MDLFQTMSVFVRVVDSGSMTSAAEQCGMSTTMVGNHLRALENRVGMSLLRRTTRKQNLTEFGVSYYQRCVEILGLVGDAERHAEAAQTSAHGTLRITAPPAFGAERLMPSLTAFLEQHPNVSLDIVLTDRVVDLVEEGFDAAIRLGTLDASRLIARQLVDYALTLCASPAYLTRYGTPTEPDALANHECLTFSYPAGTEWRWTEKQWRMQADAHDRHNEIAVGVRGRVSINHAQGLRRAALAGMGIAMLPNALIWEDVERGLLVPLLENHPLPVRPMHLVYPQERFRSPKLRAFVEFAVTTFGPDGASAPVAASARSGRQKPLDKA